MIFIGFDPFHLLCHLYFVSFYCVLAFFDIRVRVFVEQFILYIKYFLFIILILNNLLQFIHIIITKYINTLKEFLVKYKYFSQP